MSSGKDWSRLPKSVGCPRQNLSRALTLPDVMPTCPRRFVCSYSSATRCRSLHISRGDEKERASDTPWHGAQGSHATTFVLGRRHSIILTDRLGLGCALAATGITKSDWRGHGTMSRGRG